MMVVDSYSQMNALCNNNNIQVDIIFSNITNYFHSVKGNLD